MSGTTENKPQRESMSFRRAAAELHDRRWLDKRGYIHVNDNLTRQQLINIAQESGVENAAEPRAYEVHEGRVPNEVELRRRIAVAMVFSTDFMQSEMSELGRAPFYLMCGRWTGAISGVMPPYPLNLLFMQYVTGDDLTKGKIINEVANEFWPPDVLETSVNWF